MFLNRSEKLGPNGYDLLQQLEPIKQLTFRLCFLLPLRHIILTAMR